MSNGNPEQVEEQFEPEQDYVRHVQVEKPQKQKIYKRFRVRVYLDMCKYNVVHDLCEERHWKECEDTDEWNLFWYDWSVPNDVVVKMLPYQKINHFPGMEQITRKDTLARNMNRCRKAFPQLYDFFPQTYYLPNDTQEFKQDYERHKGRIYISKPVASCQGRGIKLFNQLSQIDVTEPQVVQHYITNPYLVNGYKFDLRLYVVVLQVLPYPVILYYHDGMARFCTTPFQEPNSKNLKNTYMHLTNYAINKNNENFEYNEDCDHDDQGSKQGLQTILERLEREGCDTQRLNQDIYDIILKTIFGVLPNLQHSYLSSRPGVPKFINVEDPFACDDLFFGSNCFEILGFDIMIDKDYRPWLIEVNHSPSFTCDTPLDLRIKENLIGYVMDILDIQQDDKIIYEKQMRLESVRRLYGKQTKSVLASRRKNGAGQSRRTGIQTFKPKPTYKYVQQFYAQKVLQSDGLFTMIYPLREDEEDIYREIVLNLKNPFISEQSVRNMNVIEPVRVEYCPGASDAQMRRSKPEGTLSKNQLKGQEPAGKPREPEQSPASKPHGSTQLGGAPKEQIDRKLQQLQQSAAQEMEYGQAHKNLVFRAISAHHQALLRQGSARNQKIDREVETDLLNRKMALKKMRLGDMVERLVESDEDEERAAPRTQAVDQFMGLVGRVAIRSRSMNGANQGGHPRGAKRAAADDSRVKLWR